MINADGIGRDTVGPRVSGGNGEMLVEGSKLPAVRCIISGDLMYDMATVIKNRVLYT